MKVALLSAALMAPFMGVANAAQIRVAAVVGAPGPEIGSGLIGGVALVATLGVLVAITRFRQHKMLMSSKAA